MTRRIGNGGLAVVLVLVLVALAACGGSEASPSTSAAPSGGAAVATDAPAPTVAPSQEPVSTPAARPVRMLARCAGVAVRSGPTMDDEVLARIAKLTKVRVAETVAGDRYDAGACGTSGSDWIKIDRINGTSARKLYGVRFVYAAAGFFE